MGLFLSVRQVDQTIKEAPYRQSEYKQRTGTIYLPPGVVAENQYNQQGFSQEAAKVHDGNNIHMLLNNWQD
jgi:hypothetical protein